MPLVAPGAALERLLRVLGVSGDRIPVELYDRAALWHSVLAGRRVLIVLDNAATEEQVAPLLPGAVGCLVLVTSRRRLPGLETTYAVSLDTLPVADAVGLFARATIRPGLVRESPELVTEAVELCGRLPLAIRIAAARLRSHPTWGVADLVARLRDQEQRLAELADVSGSRSVATTLAVSYHQLSADEQRLYLRLGSQPGMPPRTAHASTPGSYRPPCTVTCSPAAVPTMPRPFTARHWPPPGPLVTALVS